MTSTFFGLWGGFTAAPASPEGPTNLLAGLNDDFSAAAPPPTLTEPSGTATLLITDNKLVYTGGTLGNSLFATWANVGLIEGRSYKVDYVAADQELGTVVRFKAGSGTEIQGVGTTGEQTVTVVAGGSDDDFQLRFTLNLGSNAGAGRNLSLDSVALYAMLEPLDITGGVDENVPVGTVAATIAGGLPGSVFTLSDDAGGLFAIDGTDIVTAGEIDFDTAASHDIEVVETNSAAYGSPLSTPATILVNDLAD